MTSAPLSLRSKIKALATPQIDPTSPAHAYFLLDKIKQLHGTLESRVYTYLNPKNADLCTKLIYAVPASLAIKILSPAKTAACGLLGAVFLWKSKKETVSNNGKILLLHSLAIAFFTNILNAIPGKENFLKFSLNTALMSACLLASNHLENKTKAKEKQRTQRKPQLTTKRRT